MAFNYHVYYVVVCTKLSGNQRSAEDWAETGILLGRFKSDKIHLATVRNFKMKQQRVVPTINTSYINKPEEKSVFDSSSRGMRYDFAVLLPDFVSDI